MAVQVYRLEALAHAAYIGRMHGAVRAFGIRKAEQVGVPERTMGNLDSQACLYVNTVVLRSVIKAMQEANVPEADINMVTRVLVIAQ